MIVTLMLVLFFLMLVLGVPVAFAMGLSAILALLVQGEVPGILLPQRFFSTLDNFSLLAVPLFVLAGELMNAGGVTERLVAMSRALMGHLRGGIAQANVLTNMFMAAISGSALADLSAIGSMMIPAMRRDGYPPQLAVAVTACASMMAPIIPPSIIAVVYGSITGTSIGGLFLGGVGPGVLAGVGMIILVWYLSKRAGVPRRDRAPVREMASATFLALPAMLMPLIIVGGIIGGIFTPTEAGAVAVFYGLLFGLVLRRHSAASVYRNLSAATQVTAAALINLGGAALFAWVLARAGVAGAVLDGLFSISTDPTAILMILIVFLLLLGIFIEPMPALILSLPVLQPIAVQMGYDPVHFGIVVLMTLIVGAVSPPVGILGMVAAKIGGVTYASTFSSLYPFVALWIAVILLISFVPGLVTFLPNSLLP
ncbi:TRAP transporter large permease [Chelativorans sp. AA-79]|uniref:TRAP transporter large permease n=1 Tax=Chelativorans sp. AA-79 TaxID=3028735 RepID=UPI0023F72C70|nr:TRAP transporter large permease [Chelativorans sp. AA-79]WEX12063.1 TRAP transporter large permease [Chelativorans sp. AA-79]